MNINFWKIYNKDLIKNNHINKLVWYLYMEEWNIKNIDYDGLLENPNITWEIM